MRKITIEIEDMLLDAVENEESLRSIPVLEDKIIAIIKKYIPNAIFITDEDGGYIKDAICTACMSSVNIDDVICKVCNQRLEFLGELEGYEKL